jgi:hypothetical protein
VAQYANACNIFGADDEVRHKLDVLRSHCAHGPSAERATPRHLCRQIKRLYSRLGV